MSDSSEDVLGRLDGILRILVRSHEEAAQNTLLLSRESDLRVAAARIRELGGRTQGDAWLSFQIATEAVVGGVIAVSLGALGPIAGLLAIGLLVVWLAFRRTFIASDIKHFQELERWTQLASDEYIRHSAIKIQIRKGQQLQVGSAILLASTYGHTWQEIESRGQTNDVRDQLDRIATLDGRRLLDELRFDQAGGEIWLAILQATVRSELPLFVFQYLHMSQRERPIGDWHSSVASTTRAASLLSESGMSHSVVADLRRLVAIVSERLGFRPPPVNPLVEQLKAVREYSVCGLHRILAIVGEKSKPFDEVVPKSVGCFTQVFRLGAQEVSTRVMSTADRQDRDLDEVSHKGSDDAIASRRINQVRS